MNSRDRKQKGDPQGRQSVGLELEACQSLDRRRFLLSLSRWAIVLGGAAAIGLALDPADAEARECSEIRTEINGLANNLRYIRAQLAKETNAGQKRQLENRLDHSQKQFYQAQNEWNRKKCKLKK
jgi:hypothetical protein